MCIDCATDKLGVLAAAFAPGAAGWYMCVRDHDAHVHVRVRPDGVVGDAGDDGASSEWVQVNSDFDVPKQALAQMGIRHRFHVHENAPAAKGLSTELIELLPHVKFDAAAASRSAASDDLCAVCYDAFGEGDIVAQLP